MGNQLKELHDQLLADKPDDAVHVSDECPMCAMESDDNNNVDQPEGGSMSDKTFSQEDVDAAVKAAVETKTSELQAQLSELQNSQAQSDKDQAVAAARTERETEFKELQAKLDTAVLEAQNEKQAREDLEAKIENDKTAADEAAALEARRGERLDKVKEVASFPDEYLTANADRWAAMTDDEFNQSIEDWKAIASKTGATPPATTAMTASRVEGGNPTSQLGSLGSLRRDLVGKSL